MKAALSGQGRPGEGCAGVLGGLRVLSRKWPCLERRVPALRLGCAQVRWGVSEDMVVKGTEKAVREEESMGRR